MPNQAKWNDQVGRPDFLEGMRGIASWMVVICHLMLAFYPFYWSNDYSLYSSKSSFIRMLIFSPLNHFMNGHFAVMLFFVHSGLVLSYKYFLTQNKNVLLDSSIKRYPRLAIPAILSVMIGWALLQASWIVSQEVVPLTGSTWWLKSNFGFEPNFFKALYQGVFLNFFSSSVPFAESYNSSLWTIGTEFIGSYLVFCFLALFGNYLNRWVFYCFAAFYFLNSYFFAFILGVFLCDLYVQWNRFFKSKAWGWASFLFGLYLGSVRFSNAPLYRWTAYLKENIFFEPIQMFGAFFVVFGILALPSIQRILLLKPFQFLGKISYSVYLLHISILCSVGCGLFRYLLQNQYFSFRAAAFLASLSVCIVTLLCAVLYRKYVDEPSIQFSKKWVSSQDKEKLEVISPGMGTEVFS